LRLNAKRPQSIIVPTIHRVCPGNRKKPLLRCLSGIDGEIEADGSDWPGDWLVTRVKCSLLKLSWLLVVCWNNQTSNDVGGLPCSQRVAMPDWAT